MKTKQEQIEEIEITVRHNCNKQGIAKHCPERISNGIYSAGYRKASDVIDEFAERLAKKEIIGRVKGELTFVVPCEDIKKIIIEMRQEAEKEEAEKR